MTITFECTQHIRHFRHSKVWTSEILGFWKFEVRAKRAASQYDLPVVMLTITRMCVFLNTRC